MLLVSFLSIPPFVFIVDGILHIVLFFCSLDADNFQQCPRKNLYSLIPLLLKLPLFPAPQPMSFNNVNSWCFFTRAG